MPTQARFLRFAGRREGLCSAFRSTANASGHAALSMCKCIGGLPVDSVRSTPIKRRSNVILFQARNHCAWGPCRLANSPSSGLTTPRS